MLNDKNNCLKLGIITGNYGNGHNAAANALRDGLKTWYPEIPITVINNREVVGPLADSFASTWYRLSTGRGGRTYGAFCRRTENVDSMRRHVWFANAIWARHYERLLRRRGVGFAVMTYPATARSLDTMPHLRGYDVVVTDLSSLHAYWQCGQRCHRYIVPTQEAFNDLSNFGVSADKINIVGYPLRLPFLHPPTREEARRQLGLAAMDRVAVYLPGSGAGINPSEVVKIMDEFPDLTTFVVCGHDDAMRRRLSRVAQRTRLTGFVDNFETYLAAADFAVGKAGPGFLVEAAAIGIPVAITGYIEPQERGNIDIATNHGWGKVVRNAAELRIFIQSAPLLHHHNEQKSLAGTRQIVDLVVADYRAACPS